MIDDARSPPLAPGRIAWRVASELHAITSKGRATQAADMLEGCCRRAMAA